MMRQYELVERVRAYDPEADEDLLNRAYVFAMKAHGSQLRASGDPYFHHPVEVAGILTGFRLDCATIATALLHDTVEDTGATLEEIDRLFGPTVARLVDGVTKLNKLELQSAQTAQAENFRKLLLAMSDDIRVLLVKLADRLHNMRTLNFIKTDEKRRRIAIETMEIYAPLAERIGMDSVRAELEDLAFGHLWPDAKASISHRLGQLRRDEVDLVQRITVELTETLAAADITAEVSGREKAAYSIWRKMERKNMSFEQLSDIMAFRVLVADVADCYAALGIIHGHYAMLPGRFKDFISTPKPNGYRSLHTTIIGPEKRKIEVQIRTLEMHEFAQLGVAAHWAYKDNAAITEGRRYRWIRELLDILEHANGPEEFLENTKLEMYEDQVFCFSPKGDLIALPRGATPVDFAYAVHSQVGDHCVGAKVDGRMVQLRYRLQNGDQVEIVTSKNAAPTAAWERFVVTGKARARIRRYLRVRQRSDFVAQGRDIMQKLAKSEHVAITDKLLERALANFTQKTVDDLLASIGEGTVGPKLVLDAVYPELKRPALPDVDQKVVPIRRKTEDQPVDKKQSPILGLPVGTAFHYAGCCHPIPGDAIIGIVRSGRSIAVHRMDCAVIGRDKELVERAIDIGWNDKGARTTRARARLALVFLNKPGALGLVSTVVGKLDANILDVRFGRRSGELLEIALDVEVTSLEHVSRIMAALRGTEGVCSVERSSS
ncbi:RelA/SpoT family protein [Arboricoccus pini]|uniref:RelA/SpoT family protein n=1 Tax=Arboricoccus pini TaxID=1963835 RepID=UPI000B50EA6C|nr:bifunctional (p)ppGpp synthetase/guanosine-3',5'-bis(diphosphate) 3'-pyrophosphohydrolase [Arboricoccus pini]